MFLQGKKTMLSQLCLKIGATIKITPQFLNVCKNEASDYCEQNKRACLIPFGMGDIEFEKIMLHQLKRAIRVEKNPQRYFKKN